MHGQDPASVARSVLEFWLGEVPPEKRFVRDDVLDATIRTRFGGLHTHLMASHAADFRADARTTLAAVIVLDQFSRNLFRGAKEAFASDPLARELARHAIERGWDASMTRVERQFLYLPFMHAENRDDQAFSMKLYEALGDPNVLSFARRHAEQIERFGRFPQRNEALGRVTTEEEAAFLTRPHARF